jgi:hypothetical protein
MRILGVLLILLGLTLFASLRITYTKTEEIPHTRFAAKRQKTIVIPRPVAPPFWKGRTAPDLSGLSPGGVEVGLT